MRNWCSRSTSRPFAVVWRAERLRTDLELELRETVSSLLDADATTRHATLKAQFEGAGRRPGATAEALDAFVELATARYGAFESVEIIGRPRAARSDGARPESLAGLRFSFVDRSLIGEVRYALAPSFGGDSLMPGVLLLALRIDDDRIGVIGFPELAAEDESATGSDGDRDDGTDPS